MLVFIHKSGSKYEFVDINNFITYKLCMKFIIMAGGQGTKLWPLSTEARPKQFSNIIGGKSLFQRNLEDLLSSFSPDDIFVSTSEDYKNYVYEQAHMLPKENFIFEPHIKKGTGPASCYSMAHMLKKFPNEVISFYVQPVVIREPREAYIEMLKEMEVLVKRHGKLITGVMKPTHPEVGSDYIELGQKLDSTGSLEVYTNNHFVERPKTMEEAIKMIETTSLGIHCNHYAWTPAKFFESLSKHHKNWFDISIKMAEELENNATFEQISNIYNEYEPGNVEIFTKKVYEDEGVQIVMLPFNWIHITTWNDVYEYLAKNTDATLQGNVVQVNSKNNLVINNTTQLVSVLGLNDIVVIQTEEATLICPKSMSGKLSELLNEVDNKGYDALL